MNIWIQKIRYEEKAIKEKVKKEKGISLNKMRPQKNNIHKYICKRRKEKK